MSNTVVIMYCSCIHSFQDRMYGPSKRLMNQTIKSDGHIYRCTVCERERMT